MVVLRNSHCDRIGCVEDLEMGRRTSGWLCFLGFCRDAVDSESAWWISFSARTLLVVASMECTEGPDHHKCDHVCAGWCFRRIAVEVERVARCDRVKLHYRASPVHDTTRSDGIR